MPSNVESSTPRRFESDDEGKRVLTAGGDVVGFIDRVRHGTAYIEADPGLFKGTGSMVFGPWSPAGPLPLDGEYVESVDEDAVVLKTVDDTRTAEQDR